MRKTNVICIYFFLFPLHKLLFHFKKMAYFIGSTLLCVKYLTTPKYACFFWLLFKWATLFYFQFKHFSKQTYLFQLFCNHLKRYFVLNWHLSCHSVFFHVICFTSKSIMDYFILSLCPWCHIHVVDTHEYALIFQDCLSMLKQSFLSASLLQCLD